MNPLLVYFHQVRQEKLKVLVVISLFITSFMPLWLLIGRAWTDIAICGISFLFLLFSILTRDWSWLRFWESKLLLMLWLYMVLQSAWTAPNTDAVITALKFGRFLLFYLALRFWVLNSILQLKPVVIIGAFIIVLAAIDGYVQYITGLSLSGRELISNRLSGAMSHPHLGHYIFKLTLPIFSGMILFYSQNRKYFASIIIACLFTLLLIPLSGERSTTAMFLVSLCVIFTLCAMCPKQPRKHVILSLILMVIIGYFVSIQPVVEERTHLLLYQLSQFWDTPYGHILSAGLYQLRQHLWLGIGVNQFLHLCSPVIAGPYAHYCFVHPHNFYIQWLAETGILGFSLLSVFFILLLYKVYVHYRMIEDRNKLSLYIAIGALIGFLFPFVGSQNNFSNWPASIYWYSLALIISIIEHHRTKQAS